MYLEHFDLTANPFGLSPRLDFLYKSEAFEEGIAHLVYGVDNAEAIIMITGAIGTGKTMALQSFLTNLGSQFHSALVTNTQVNTVELLKLILDDLEVVFPPGCDKSDLLILFKNLMLESSLGGQRLVIVIDEAQNLAPAVLEEVRLLTNLGQGESQPVQIVLVGQPELEQLVNDPSLAQLRQRIRVHCRLDTLSRKELGEYLDHRMMVGGCSKKVFRPDAVDRIFSFSSGVPRLVNSVAGNALLSAFVAGRHQVAVEDIEKPEGETRAVGPDVDSTAPISTPEASSAPMELSADPPTFTGIDEPRIESRSEFAKRRRRGRGWPLSAALVIILILAAVALYMSGRLDGSLARILGGTSSNASTVTVAPPRDRTPVSEPSRPESMADEAGDAVMSEQVLSEEQPVTPTSANDEAGGGEEPDAVPDHEFHVHVSSFREIARATGQAAGLMGRGKSAHVEPREINGQSWFRVYVGPYASYEEAAIAVERLKDEEALRYHRIVRLPVSDES